MKLGVTSHVRVVDDWNDAPSSWKVRQICESNPDWGEACDLFVAYDHRHVSSVVVLSACSDLIVDDLVVAGFVPATVHVWVRAS